MAYRWLGVLLLGVACSVGCDGSGPGDPFTGTGASGGAGGVGGEAGIGGTGGGAPIECVTSVLCQSCPTEGICETNDDCTVGHVCIESGCDDLEGASIQQCVFAGGGACNSTEDCPPERECLEVPEEGKRCIKTTPGCALRFDCVPGFTCENGSCVDRRVPCDFDVDCPMNHICVGVGFSKFCARVQVDCLNEFDCVGLAPHCEDIDGVGNKECAGVFDPNEASVSACTNAQCTDPAAPVCELAGVGSTTQCGQYGLCLDDDDCAAGFTCVGLWADGRKECVPSGGSCSSFADCPIQQVCASPREGGPPSCQTGYQP